MDGQQPGWRWEQYAGTVAARRRTVPGWAHAFAVFTDRLHRLPAPHDGRFDRDENGATALDLPPGRQEQDSSAMAAWPGGRPLPAHLLAPVRAAVGGGVEDIRVHEDGAADSMARAHTADAVTVGSDIYFRTGKFAPHQPEGFALLVHEATHAAGETHTPGTPAGAREEQLALTRERAALSPHAAGTTRPGVEVVPDRSTPLSGHRDRSPILSAADPFAPAPLSGVGPLEPTRAALPRPASMSPVVPARASAAAPASAPAPVHRAPEDRQLDTPAPAAAAPSPAAAELDLAALRRDLIEDVTRRLRTEFERGG